MICLFTKLKFNQAKIGLRNKPIFIKEFVDFKHIKQKLHRIKLFACIFKEFRTNMVEPYYRWKGNKYAYFRTKIAMIFRKCWEHLRRSLGVAYVRNYILTGLLSDVVYHGWQIVLSKLIETKVPKLFIIDIRVYVLSTVNIASIISQPDVVPFFNKSEG